MRHIISTTDKNKKNRFYSSHHVYENILYGYYFKCNQYGHKVAICRSNVMHRNFINQKSFKYMLDKNVQYFRYHQYGHKAMNCRDNIRPNTHARRVTYSPQIMYNVQCFKYHNHRHLARFCRKSFEFNRWYESIFHQPQRRKQI